MNNRWGILYKQVQVLEIIWNCETCYSNISKQEVSLVYEIINLLSEWQQIKSVSTGTSLKNKLKLGYKLLWYKYSGHISRIHLFKHIKVNNCLKRLFIKVKVCKMIRINYVSNSCICTTQKFMEYISNYLSKWITPKLKFICS